MADETQAQGSPAPSPDDIFLQLLVDSVNEQPDLVIGITLNVGGTIISGQMVSIQVYLEGITKQLTTGIPEELKKDLAEPFNDLLAAAKDYYKQPEEDRDTIGKARYYIHLRRVSMTVPPGNSLMFPEAFLWRGRLEAIDGFILGDMAPAPGPQAPPPA